MNPMKLNITVIISLWLVLVGASLWWNLHQAHAMRAEIALESGRLLFEQIVLTRRWNARHGRVYAPVSDHSPPNPYLEHLPDRDVRVNDAMLLTVINPAYMTRQLSELAQLGSGVNFHITSLNLLRPENVPEAWEAHALQQFEMENGLREFSEFFTHENGQTGFRYIAPLITEQACLACHAHQGYQVGDIRGGISITLPKVTNIPTLQLVSSHWVIAFVGSVLVMVLGRMLKQSHHLLAQQALVDNLTNIPNRRFFNQQIDEEYRRLRRESKTLSLAMLDIDHFKQFNDRFGHQAGDDCIIRIAQLISQLMQRGGDFCARYGGEEFVIVLPNINLSGAMQVAEKIRHAVEQARIDHPDSQIGVVTVSVGVACCDANAMDQDHLLRQADAALYRAKGAGRNRVETYTSV